MSGRKLTMAQSENAKQILENYKIKKAKQLLKKLKEEETPKNLEKRQRLIKGSRYLYGAALEEKRKKRDEEMSNITIMTLDPLDPYGGRMGGARLKIKKIEELKLKLPMNQGLAIQKFKKGEAEAKKNHTLFVPDEDWLETIEAIPLPLPPEPVKEKTVEEKLAEALAEIQKLKSQPKSGGPPPPPPMISLEAMAARKIDAKNAPPEMVAQTLKAKAKEKTPEELAKEEAAKLLKSKIKAELDAKTAARKALYEKQEAEAIAAKLAYSLLSPEEKLKWDLEHNIQTSAQVSKSEQSTSVSFGAKVGNMRPLADRPPVPRVEVITQVDARKYKADYEKLKKELESKQGGKPITASQKRKIIDTMSEVINVEANIKKENEIQVESQPLIPQLVPRQRNLISTMSEVINVEIPGAEQVSKKTREAKTPEEIAAKKLKLEKSQNELKKLEDQLLKLKAIKEQKVLPQAKIEKPEQGSTMVVNETAQRKLESDLYTQNLMSRFQNLSEKKSIILGEEQPQRIDNIIKSLGARMNLPRFRSELENIGVSPLEQEIEKNKVFTKNMNAITSLQAILRQKLARNVADKEVKAANILKRALKNRLEKKKLENNISSNDLDWFSNQLEIQNNNIFSGQDIDNFAETINRRPTLAQKLGLEERDRPSPINPNFRESIVLNPLRPPPINPNYVPPIIDSNSIAPENNNVSLNIDRNRRRMPRFARGSAEAREYMASIRAARQRRLPVFGPPNRPGRPRRYTPPSQVEVASVIPSGIPVAPRVRRVRRVREAPIIPAAIPATVIPASAAPRRRTARLPVFGPPNRRGRPSRYTPPANTATPPVARIRRVRASVVRPRRTGMMSYVKAISRGNGAKTLPRPARKLTRDTAKLVKDIASLRKKANKTRNIASAILAGGKTRKSRIVKDTRSVVRDVLKLRGARRK